MSLAAPRRATFAADVTGDMVTVGYVWVGDPESGGRLLPPLRSFGRPRQERVIETSYLGLQTRDDVTGGHALRRYMKGHDFREVTDDAVQVLLAGASNDTCAPSASIQAYGGAIADVADEDTAFSHRGTGFELVASSRWSDRDEDDSRIEATRRYGASLDRFSSGAYVNVLADEGAAGVRRAYTPHKLAQLTAVKDEYDPDNVFHLNHNIRPSRDATAASGPSA